MKSIQQRLKQIQENSIVNVKKRRQLLKKLLPKRQIKKQQKVIGVNQKQINKNEVKLQEMQNQNQILRKTMDQQRKQNQEFSMLIADLQNRESFLAQENQKYHNLLISKEKELKFHVEKLEAAAKEIEQLNKRYAYQAQKIQKNIKLLSLEIEKFSKVSRETVQNLNIISAKNSNNPNQANQKNQYERGKVQMIQMIQIIQQYESKYSLLLLEIQRLHALLHAQKNKTSSIQPLLKRNQYLQSTNKVLKQQRVNALQILRLAREENNYIQRKYSDINKQYEKLDQQLKRKKEFAESKEEVNQMEVYELTSLKIREDFHLKEKQYQKHIEYLSNNYCELQKICREFDGSMLPNNNEFLQFPRQYRQHRLKIIRESLILVHDEGFQDSIQFVDLLKELNKSSIK